MSAGLPGFGLGGLFFILSALIAPLIELVRMMRGRSSAAAWRAVWRQFAIAVTMIVAIELTLRGVLLAASATGLGGAPAPGVLALPLKPIGLAIVLLCVLLGAAKALELTLRWRRRLPSAAAAGAALRLASRFRFDSAMRVLTEADSAD